MTNRTYTGGLLYEPMLTGTTVLVGISIRAAEFGCQAARLYSWWPKKATTIRPGNPAQLASTAFGK